MRFPKLGVSLDISELGWATTDQANLDWQLVGYTVEGALSNRFRDSVEFKEDSAWLNASCPVVDITFT